MRRVIGYMDGRAIWSANVPASPGSSKIGGQLVVGASGPNDSSRHRDEQRRHKAKVNGQKRIVTA